MGKFSLKNLFGKSAKQAGSSVEEKTDNSREKQEKLDKILARVDELVPPVETVRLKPMRGETTVFSSKMGGVPYFPKSMEYPTVREGNYKGKPLCFLAQLNFEELPRLEGFPDKGILQFFIGCDGGFSYGADEDPCFQNAFRVIYHENVIADKNLLCSKKELPEFRSGMDLPFGGEFLLTAEATEKMNITDRDFRYDDAILTAHNEIFGTNYDKIYEAGRCCVNAEDIEIFDALSEEVRVTSGTRMGGFPLADPRGDDPAFAGYTILLFQSDSENIGNTTYRDTDLWIDWGFHGGVGNFFITPEDLAKRDFSHVLYTWDMG